MSDNPSDDQGDKQTLRLIVRRDPPPALLVDENRGLSIAEHHFLAEWMICVSARFELLEARVALLEKTLVRNRLRVVDGRRP